MLVFGNPPCEFPIYLLAPWSIELICGIPSSPLNWFRGCQQMLCINQWKPLLIHLSLIYWKNTNKSKFFERHKFSLNICVFLPGISFTVGAKRLVEFYFLFNFLKFSLQNFFRSCSRLVGRILLRCADVCVPCQGIPGHPRESGFHQTVQWFIKIDCKLICKTTHSQLVMGERNCL